MKTPYYNPLLLNPRVMLRERVERSLSAAIAKRTISNARSGTTQRRVTAPPRKP